MRSLKRRCVANALSAHDDGDDRVDADLAYNGARELHPIGREPAASSFQIRQLGFDVVDADLKSLPVAQSKLEAGHA
jgi:hypothetical protein